MIERVSGVSSRDRGSNKKSETENKHNVIGSVLVV